MSPRLLFPLVLPLIVAGQQPRKVTPLAPGVYAIEHAEADDGFGESGNTMVIIGES